MSSKQTVSITKTKPCLSSDVTPILESIRIIVLKIFFMMKRKLKKLDE